VPAGNSANSGAMLPHPCQWESRASVSRRRATFARTHAAKSCGGLIEEETCQFPRRPFRDLAHSILSGIDNQHQMGQDSLRKKPSATEALSEWKHEMTLILVLALLAHAGNPSQAAKKDTGTVEGVVVDANNKPIKDASVYADNLSLPAAGRLHTVQTDDQGHFVLDDVYPGDIVMRAFKEADMYGQVDSKFNMPDGESLVKFELKPGEIFKGIVIRLDKKAGRLQLRVLDAGNELIKGITFEMCRGDHQGDRGYCIWGTAQGDYHVFVAADAPISIKVSAPNYREWTYQDNAQKSPYLDLAPGEDRMLEIKLQPSTTN
jgi:hypothetical protein